MGAPPDVGATVFSCVGVGKNVICTVFKDKGHKTAAEIGECLKAGTNCGSCVPTIEAVLASPN
jgi:assimilatory nitrate reductase catalytic subunit